MTNYIEIKNISKQYRSKLAIDSLTLVVKKGTIFGLIGPNGAGKTTTTNIITDLTMPTSGSIRIFDNEITNGSYKKRMGVVPEELSLFDQLKGVEQLYFIGRVYGLTPAQIQKRSRELFVVFNFGQEKYNLIHTYSKGMRKKLALMCALIHDPEILILDEPFEGLDPITIRKTNTLLIKLKHRGKSVLITSHILSYIENICDEVAILNKGKIVYHNTTENIRNGFKERMKEDSKLSALEKIFLSVVDKDNEIKQTLSWLEERERTTC